ncbi:hypothetical protein ACNVED_01280 [Legionella sp. D16C41]|uniref:hypothetical protein n=1 Tax=Legionella sp. D16C41 TaxID=3402688 RepID=UPI003AF6C053
MKKVMILLAVSLLGLVGCTTSESIYNPRYNRDYVYSVGFYGYQPQWVTNYYSGVPTQCGLGCSRVYPRGWYMRKW